MFTASFSFHVLRLNFGIMQDGEAQKKRLQEDEPEPGYSVVGDNGAAWAKCLTRECFRRFTNHASDAFPTFFQHFPVP